MNLVYSYTRAQAIADGVLVDLSKSPLVKEAGFRIPVAMTAGAFAKTVVDPDVELPPGQDVEGRLWDVLTVLRVTILASPEITDRVHFKVSVWNGRYRENVNLWAHTGPGDSGEPVLTIMLEGED